MGIEVIYKYGLVQLSVRLFRKCECLCVRKMRGFGYTLGDYNVCESECLCMCTLFFVYASELVAVAEGLWASVVGISRFQKLGRPRGQQLVTATADQVSFLTVVKA